MSDAEVSEVTEVTVPGRPRVQRRSPVVVAILVLLILAGVADATIKHDRVVARSAPSAALSVVQMRSAASSVAWYCAGPLPLGLKHEQSSLVLANVSYVTVRGEYSIATASGPISSEPLVVSPRTSLTIVLPTMAKTAYSSATVLTNGSGLAVSEEIRGPGGADISPCVNHATQTQYIAGGATTRPNTVALSLFDPGATPSVASVSFATPNGVVSPPAFQGVPIASGATSVVDVGRYLPSEAILATTVTSTGGPVVVGALESSVAGKSTLPSLVNAVAVAEKEWWIAPAPAGTSAPRQKFTILNPGTVAATVMLHTAGAGGTATLTAVVPPGEVAALAPAAQAAPGSLRWATVTSDQPVVVSRATTLFGGQAATTTSGAGKAPALTGQQSVIANLPPGYTISDATPALAKSWLVGDGESDAGEGELILIANPSDQPVTVKFSSLSSGALPQPSPVPAGSAVVVSVPTSGSGTVIIVTANAPVVVDSGNYARGSAKAVGWSSPGAIVVD